MQTHHRSIRSSVLYLALAALVAAPSLAAQAGDAPGQPTDLREVSRWEDAVHPEDDRPRGLVTREELIVDRLRRLGVDNPDPAPRRPTSRADSLEWERHRRAAENATGRRIVVSIFDRTLWLIDGRDTLLTAPAGVGMGEARRGGRTYDFSTPRGRRTVLSKDEDPLWVPPDWHYWGMADRVRQFPAGGVQLSDGRRVIRRGDRIGILSRNGDFEALPREHSLMFEGTLYIPPFGTINRQVPEVLGKYRINLGEAILIHGTNDPIAVGFPATHGCIRLDDDDIEFVYDNTPVGTRVFIY
jgi:hypothetical protein